MLQLHQVTKRYGALTALDGVSLDIAHGEFFGLLGPNGAGKSTLMSLIAGLRVPDAGTLTLDGKTITPSDPSARTSLGLVPQHIALYPELSADENLRIFGELYRLRGADLQARIDEALEAVQLADRRREPIKRFSGGMQRRLNLVAALLHRPKILLCDEPTVGVDPQSRNAIFEYLQRLNREGLTVIYSTHYMEEATRLCSRIGSSTTAACTPLARSTNCSPVCHSRRRYVFRIRPPPPRSSRTSRRTASSPRPMGTIGFGRAPI